MNDTTAHSEANHPSADCYQPDGRVQLEGVFEGDMPEWIEEEYPGIRSR